jgi:subtilisin family serine protease
MGAIAAGLIGIASVGHSEAEQKSCEAPLVELLVKFAPNEQGNSRSVTEKNNILEQYGCGVVEREYEFIPDLCLVRLPSGLDVEKAVKKLIVCKESAVIYAEPNCRIRLDSTVPSDPFFFYQQGGDYYQAYQWALNNNGDPIDGWEGDVIADADIDAPEAWDIATGYDAEVIVGVIDSGIQYSYSEFESNMWVNPAPNSPVPTIISCDGNYSDKVYEDDIYGIDAGEGDGNPFATGGHGSAVASVIGAVPNNGEGMAGVSWDLNLMALKMEENDVADAIECINYGLSKGVRIFNLSWHLTYHSACLEDAINAAGEQGALFIVAAGNEGYDLDDETLFDTNKYYSIAGYDCDSIISVLATNPRDQIVTNNFESNFGSTTVDLGAPGVCILAFAPSQFSNYNNQEGTSFASPHVAGACALIWSYNPYLTAQEVKDVILCSVDVPKSSSGNNKLAGLCVTEGRLNLYNSLKNCMVFNVQKEIWYESASEALINSDTGDVIKVFNENGYTFVTNSVEPDFSISADGNGLMLSWNSYSGVTYRVCSSDSVQNPTWSAASENLTATSSVSSWVTSALTNDYYCLQAQTEAGYTNLGCIVGYSRQIIASNELAIVVNQFVVENEGGDSLGATFESSQLQSGSVLSIFNGVLYDTYTYYEGYGWYDSLFQASNVLLARGEAYWLSNTAGASMEVVFCGRIPEASAITNELSSGMSMIANPYPTPQKIGLIEGVENLDKIYVYTGDGYNVYTYYEGYGWYDSQYLRQDGVIVPIGTGFWYNSSSGMTWIKNRPYDL